MQVLSNIETIKSNLTGVRIKPGQLIYCTDSIELFYDTSENTRIKVTDTIPLATEDDRTNILAPLTDKIYYVIESNLEYKYDGDDWIRISYVHPDTPLIRHVTDVEKDKLNNLQDMRLIPRYIAPVKFQIQY